MKYFVTYTFQTDGSFGSGRTFLSYKSEIRTMEDVVAVESAIKLLCQKEEPDREWSKLFLTSWRELEEDAK